jgi:hypothetical protein
MINNHPLLRYMSTMNIRSNILGFIAFLFCVLVIPSTASAGYVFSPYNCSQCPNYGSTYSYKWQAYGSNLNSWDVMTDPYCRDFNNNICYYYQYNLDYKFYTLANRYVKSLKMNYSFVDIETNFDKIHHGFDDTSQENVLTGSYPFGTSVESTATHSYQSTPQYTRFVSDGSINDRGIITNSVRACCDSNATNYMSYLRIGERYKGVLLAQHDVINTRVHTYTYTNRAYSFVLKSPESSSADFDLYMKCNSVPTVTNYDKRSTHFDSQEYIHIAPGECNGITYLTVHSYSGTGSFDLIATRHDGSAAHHTLTASTNNYHPGLNAEQKIVDTMRNGAKYFFNMTKGRVIVDRIDYYNNADCNNCNGSRCDICFFDNDNDVSNAGNNRIEMYKRNHNQSSVFAHEMGHYILNINDEYDRGTHTECGHSLSGSYRNYHNYCTSFNHNKNGSPNSSLPYREQDAVWVRRMNAPYINDLKTLENSDLRGHYMGGVVGQVVYH